MIHRAGLGKVGLDAEDQNRQVQVGTEQLRLRPCAVPADQGALARKHLSLPWAMGPWLEMTKAPWLANNQVVLSCKTTAPNKLKKFEQIIVLAWASHLLDNCLTSPAISNNLQELCSRNGSQRLPLQHLQLQMSKEC